uniref:Nucleolar protein 14 n=1 Tax=Setaria digitata TaxID=48799 RepID=A0A915Q596_9BILA
MNSEKRGEASERQKTEEEIAHEEREKLIKQEKARLARIYQDDINERTTKSKIGNNKEDDFMVKYDSAGLLINAEKLKKGRIKVVRIDSSDEDNDSDSYELDEGSGEEEFDAMVEGDEEIDLPPPIAGNFSVNEEMKAQEEAGNGELPYVIDLPQKYENLKKLLDLYGVTNCEVVIKRLIKLYHPSLREGNKSRLNRLFMLLLSARYMRALLRQQYALHSRAPREMFTFRFIAFLKLVSVLYPVRDVFHPVVSPTLAFAYSLISTVRICGVRDIARVLLMLRMHIPYIPEVMAFLHGVFLTAVESREDERCPTATFPISMPHRRMLFVTNDCSDVQIPSELDAVKVFSDDIDRPFSNLLSRLPREKYPSQLLTELSALESFITAESLKNPLKQLQRPEKRKKMLDMLEPRFEEGYDVEKAHYGKNIAKKSKKVEIKQLTKKYKKELRGTVRELRRDNQFLNREKRQEMLENDQVRKEKTKWLISTLQGQESEYKKNAYMKHKV